MQFIEGQPLSEVIRQLRSQGKKAATIGGGEPTLDYPAPANGVTHTPRPAVEVTSLTSEARHRRDYFRKVAELGVQAAEALDHAHQLGIVHRDIKPGNLLLDTRGHLWVADFGLAYMQHSEASLTVTGQALGTPRYMSPEQALARRVPIDHRTDVYSLGVTLYELLTLRPAFPSEDRQELLRQITSEDPVPPRRLERAVPKELQIIVLKAMEKRPQDRYGTAQELADDLRRWLLDQPIQARRPGMVQRTAKWGRRHRPLVVAAALSLFLAVLLLAISNAVIWYEHETTKDALKKARIHEQEVDLLVARMAALREESETKLQRSLEAMDRLLTALEDPLPEEGTEAARIYKTVSEQAIQLYQDLLPIQAVSPSLSMEVIWGCVRLGNQCALNNRFTEAQQAYLGATLQARRLAGKFRAEGRPASIPLREGEIQADPHAPFFGQASKRPAVEKAYHRALDHWRKTAPAGLGSIPDYRIALEDPVGKVEDSSLRIPLWERAVQELPTAFHVHQLLTLCRDTGGALRRAGQFEDEKALYYEVLNLIERAVHDPLFAASLAAPTFRIGTTTLGEDYQNFGITFSFFGYREAIYLADNLYLVTQDLDNRGMLADAEIAFRVSAYLYRQFIAARQTVPLWVVMCAPIVEEEGKLSALLSGHQQPADLVDHLGLAWIYQDIKKCPVAALRCYRAAFAAEPKLTGDQPSLHRYNAACAAAVASYGQGKDATDLDDPERAQLRQQALSWLRADLQAWQQFLEKEPEKTRLQVQLQMHHWLQDSDFGRAPYVVTHTSGTGAGAASWQERVDEGVGLRSPAALAKLPEAERKEWQQLWEDVEALRKRAEQSPGMAHSARPGSP